MSEFGRLNSAVDQMFDQVERKPFSAFAPNSVIDQSSHVPLNPGGVAQDTLLPQYLQFGMAGGISNGNFTEGPEDGDGSVIDNINNKLPGWDARTVNPTVLEWRWNDDGSVTAYGADGATESMTLYLETDIPVTQVGRIIRPRALVQTTADATVRLSTQFLDTSGTAVDTILISEVSGTPYDTDRSLEQWVTPKWGSEAYMHVQLFITLVNDISADDTPLATLSQAWVEPPVTYDVSLEASRSSFDPAADTSYAIRRNEFISFDVATYRATADGFLMGYSGQTDASISAGKAQVYVENVTQSTDIYLGNDVAGTYFSSTASEVRAERLLRRAHINESPYDFLAGDELQIRITTDSSWSSGSGDWHFDVRLLQTFGEPVTGSGGGSSGWTIAS